MKIVRWIIIFSIAFLASWVIIFTFNKEPFKAQVPAKILVWQTQSIPVYIYLTFAFCLGFVIGLLIVLYNAIVYRSKLSRANKKIHKLEQDLSSARYELEQLQKISSDGKSATKQEDPPKAPLE